MFMSGDLEAYIADKQFSGDVEKAKEYLKENERFSIAHQSWKELSEETKAEYGVKAKRYNSGGDEPVVVQVVQVEKVKKINPWVTYQKAYKIAEPGQKDTKVRSAKYHQLKKDGKLEEYIRTHRPINA